LGSDCGRRAVFWLRRLNSQRQNPETDAGRRSRLIIGSFFGGSEPLSFGQRLALFQRSLRLGGGPSPVGRPAMILVWGVPKDPPVAAVIAALARLGQLVFFFDQHDAFAAEMDLCVDREVSGVLRLPAGDVDLAKITAEFIRPYETSRLPTVTEAPPALQARV